MVSLKNFALSVAATASLVSSTAAVHVACGIITCGNYGNGNVGGGAGVILTTVVDGKTTARQRTGSSALNLYPGCKGEDFGNGIKMFVCTNNPFNIVGGGYCEYNGQRFDFEERGAPTDTCQNVFPQYGPYSEASALQYSAGADF